MDEDALVETLTTALTDTVALLESVGERHWSAWLRSDLVRVELRDVYGLRHLVGAFGGMGSLNDLLVCRANGHAVERADEPAVNERLATLLATVHRSAHALLSAP